MLLMMLIIEFMALIISLRGTILDSRPRKFLRHLIYCRLVLVIVELCFMVLGLILVLKFNKQFQHDFFEIKMKQMTTTLILLNSLVLCTIFMSIACSYDKAGRSFYKLKRLEKTCKKYPHVHSLAEPIRRHRYKRTIELYYKSWINRFKIFFCCYKDRKYQRAFNVIADTLSTLFYKHDLVTSDVVAGLLLLRQQQKMTTKSFNESFQTNNEKEKIFNLNIKENMKEFKELLYFYQYAIASYGWPMYAYKNRVCSFFKLLSNTKY
jgi:sn1-specific diacylglycerol lipase